MVFLLLFGGSVAAAFQDPVLRDFMPVAAEAFVTVEAPEFTLVGAVDFMPVER